MKTAYARHITDEEFAESTNGLRPEACEEARVERVISPLFDMWLRFEQAFARRAIDQLDVSDEDAETAAKQMEATNTASGSAFAYLLRHIADARLMRLHWYKVAAVWAASGTSGSLAYPEVYERYEKLSKGDA
jgi:hypothetical protein